MKYFNLLPTINYGGVYITNLFYRYILDIPIDQEFLFDYRMKLGESLEDVALEVYNNTLLWWVIAIVNNIKDPFFDVLVDDEIIRENSKKQATANDVLDETKFIEIYEILSDENEEKRNIKILSKAHLNTFLSVATKLSGKKVESYQTIDKIEFENINESTYLEFIADDSKILDEDGNLII